MAQCIQCQAVDSSKNTCKLAWGECNHGFHAHCLNKWLSGDRNTCPLDNLPWKYKENK
jgi:RING-box protein 1